MKVFLSLAALMLILGMVHSQEQSNIMVLEYTHLACL